ncbi:MAG: potassium transporter TrkA [Candidatus Latescibacteria bacterium]|nr:potassium transporter TrkA [Candidatus Latescibacterota bacterium]
MLGIIGVAAMLAVLALSLVITRLATVALVLTGLSEEAARFQARSAFTGTGFTTSEAETVVDHPVRRRIIMVLMVLRSAGIVTVLVSLILSFGVESEGEGRLVRLAWLAAGAGSLILLSRTGWIDRGMRRFIEKALRRWTDLDTRDYVDLLNLSGDYRVMEVGIEEGDWIAERKLHECDLPDEGVTVLGIYRSDGAYVGAPTEEAVAHVGDTLLLYGRARTLRELDRRQAGAGGEQAHEEAKAEQRREIQRQEARERERGDDGR